MSAGPGAGWARVPGHPHDVSSLYGQVREQDLSVVIHTLAQEFDIYREVGGEPVPVARDESSNGFPRAQHGEGCPLTLKTRAGDPLPTGASSPLPLCGQVCGPKEPRPVPGERDPMLGPGASLTHH